MDRNAHRLEMRRQRRMAMRGVPERLGLAFSRGNVEMRAKPSGHGTTNFEWNGYAAVYDFEFPMWDPHGEPYTEAVAYGVSKRSLNNPNLDVPFLIGHNDAGIPLARTKSGTMQLSEDSHGTFTHVPSMDGRREEVRALASAVERGDMDEMSLAFVCTRQEWDPSFEKRTILEWDLHRGDVCAVVHGANEGTAGAWMSPVEQLSFRRPAAIGGPVLLGRERRLPTQPYAAGPGETAQCPQCRSANDTDAVYCDQCGTPMPGSVAPYQRDSGDTQQCRCGHWNAPDAKVCDQCGMSLVNDHDADDGYGMYAARRAHELLSVTQAERDKARAAGNSLPDGSYPVNNVGQLHAAAVLAASHHGDWKAAQALIRRRAKELGVDVNTLPGFGEKKSAARLLLERLASAIEDMDLAAAPDYDAAAADHPYDGTHTHAHSDYAGGTHMHAHSHDGDGDHGHSHGQSANVMVDDATGIPGEETQFSAARRLELRLRELDLEEVASRR